MRWLRGVSGELVEPGCTSPEVFEFVEASLDEIALAIDRLADSALHFAPALGRNMRAGAEFLDLFDERACIIPSVSNDMRRSFQAGNKGRRGGYAGSLPDVERRSDGQTRLADHGMDLAAQSPTRGTDGVIRTPFFAPAACWWARMMEPSITAMDSGV